MICYAKLNLNIHIIPLKQELHRLLLTDYWQPHFNHMHYHGDWHVLSLRSPGGQLNNPFADLMGSNTSYEDTLLLKELPAIAEVIDNLKCEKLSARLLNLKAGAVIKEHRDIELAFENGEARLHIPVFTNEQVEFYVENERVPMHEGECWYINANLPHRVANNGLTDRIHLVIDCKVNEWLIETFEQAEKKTREDIIDKDVQLRIIETLRLQNTPTATDLANRLEQELNQPTQLNL